MRLQLLRRPRRLSLALLVLVAALPLAGTFFCISKPAQSAGEVRPGPRLLLRPGDHVSIIGNTLADRMQHDGWLETFLHSRFPRYQLTIRNLGFSGDELTHRERSDGFGSPDVWLAANKTDVVFAFF